MEKIYIKVDGMVCGHCYKTVSLMLKYEEI